MEILRKVDEKRRIRLDSRKRGLLSDQVLLSISGNAILMEPYDQFKAQLPEVTPANFDSDNRIVLPLRFCMPLNIQQMVSIQYKRDGSILIKPVVLHCVVCGNSKGRLFSIAHNPNTFICEDCCRQKK